MNLNNLYFSRRCELKGLIDRLDKKERHFFLFCLYKIADAADLIFENQEVGCHTLYKIIMHLVDYRIYMEINRNIFLPLDISINDFESEIYRMRETCRNITTGINAKDTLYQIMLAYAIMGQCHERGKNIHCIYQVFVKDSPEIFRFRAPALIADFGFEDIENILSQIPPDNE